MRKEGWDLPVQAQAHLALRPPRDTIGAPLRRPPSGPAPAAPGPRTLAGSWAGAGRDAGGADRQVEDERGGSRSRRPPPHIGRRQQPRPNGRLAPTLRPRPRRPVPRDERRRGLPATASPAPLPARVAPPPHPLPPPPPSRPLHPA